MKWSSFVSLFQQLPTSRKIMVAEVQVVGSGLEKLIGVQDHAIIVIDAHIADCKYTKVQ